jgi:hypothetical protein
VLPGRTDAGCSAVRSTATTGSSSGDAADPADPADPLRPEVQAVSSRTGPSSRAGRRTRTGGPVVRGRGGPRLFAAAADPGGHARAAGAQDGRSSCSACASRVPITP